MMAVGQETVLKRVVGVDLIHKRAEGNDGQLWKSREAQSSNRAASAKVVEADVGLVCLKNSKEPCDCSSEE